MFLEALKKKIRAKFVTGSLNRNDREGALCRAWSHVFGNQMRGDYVEFGVYHGDSFVESFTQYSQCKGHQHSELKSAEPWRREAAKSYIDYEPLFHGLDTFAGLPDNDEGSIPFKSGNFVADFDSVRRRCENAGMQGRHRLYKGLFKDTADNLLANCPSAAIINIDCDLYESTVDALKISNSLIQIGTVILFDDFNCFNADMNRGQRKALSEWQETSPFILEKWFSYQYAGQAFLCVGSH